jgi:hypothetical protein
LALGAGLELVSVLVSVLVPVLVLAQVQVGLVQVGQDGEPVQEYDLDQDSGSVAVYLVLWACFQQVVPVLVPVLVSVLVLGTGLQLVPVLVPVLVLVSVLAYVLVGLVLGAERD